MRSQQRRRQLGPAAIWADKLVDNVKESWTKRPRKLVWEKEEVMWGHVISVKAGGEWLGAKCGLPIDPFT